MLVIGEKINATRKSVGKAISERDADFIAQLALDQVSAGADYIDVNSGDNYGTGDTSATEWLVETVQKATDKPITIDSDVPEVIFAALSKYSGSNVMLNSVTAEPERLHKIGPVAVEKNALLIALAMDTQGIPETVAKRLDACETVMNYLTGIGMKAEQIYFDPLVLPISVNANQGMVTLKTIEEIKKRFGRAKTVMGLSNISYGLPGRKLVNRSFLLMATYTGLDAVIMDPKDGKMMSAVKTAELLTGRDPRCMKYVRAFRQGKITEEYI